MAKIYIVEDYNNEKNYLFETKEEAQLSVIRAYVNYFNNNIRYEEKSRENATPAEIIDDLENILAGYLWDRISIYEAEVDGEVIL